MKLKFKRTTPVLTLLLLLTFVLSCAGAAAPQSPGPISTPTPGPNVFKTSTLTVNPPEAVAGIQVIVTAKVTNTSGNGVAYTPRLRIDNVSRESLPTFLYLRDINIAGGATQQLSFSVPADNPGKYRVTWGEIAGEFLVTESTPQVGSASNATAPDFTAVDVVTNKRISLSQFKGSLVLLNVVNYGCDPSLNNIVSKQLLAIKELQKQRSDFVPVSVFCGCCPPEVLRDFAKQNNFSWPWILDADNSIARKYMTYLRKFGYPTLVFIDKEQYVRDYAGYSDLRSMSARLDTMLGKGATY